MFGVLGVLGAFGDLGVLGVFGATGDFIAPDDLEGVDAVFLGVLPAWFVD